MQTKFTGLTDSQWQYIEKILEKEQGKRKRHHDLREIFTAIIWLTRTGVQWRNLDSKYPGWSIVYYYFNKWHKMGILKKRLSKDYERTTASAIAFIQLAFCSIILARNPTIEI
jgi:transposase